MASCRNCGSNLSPNGRWKRRSGDETRYWAESLLADDAKEVFAERLDPRAPITGSLLTRALDEVPGENISILDVGSGPLTSVGKTYPGRRITVVAVDPLADDYAHVLSDSSLEAPVPAIACGGEELVERFGQSAFDIVYALNSLDHSADPMLVLENMATVLKPGGQIALQHMQNEGERNGYFGIHFWNIDCQDGRFVIWNRSEWHEVASELGERLEIESWLTDQQWVYCLIRTKEKA